MTKANVYEMVTERIIAELEKGNIPWQKPWTGVRSGAYNRISKKAYSIINQMLLQHTGEYATFKQWTDLGGHIRKGAPGVAGEEEGAGEVFAVVQHVCEGEHEVRAVSRVHQLHLVIPIGGVEL